MVNVMYASDGWDEVLRKKLPKHELVRVGAFLGPTQRDPIARMEWVGISTAPAERLGVVYELLVSAQEGAGVKLRSTSPFGASSNELLTPDTIRLCEIEAVRFVIADIHVDQDSVPQVYCRHDQARQVQDLLHAVENRAALWRGTRRQIDVELETIDESRYALPAWAEDLEQESIGFLKGSAAAKLREWGVAPRRGILLTGSPGNGKTVQVRRLIRKALGDDLSVTIIEGNRRSSMYWHPMFSGIGDELRFAVSHGPGLIVVEDIDLHCERRSVDDVNEAHTKSPLSEVLDFLDGTETGGEYVLIATTNYADKLDPALLRPGRLDVRFDVETPDLATRRDALMRQLHDVKEWTANVDEVAGILEGASLAGVAEVVRRFKIEMASEQGGEGGAGLVELAVKYMESAGAHREEPTGAPSK